MDPRVKEAMDPFFCDNFGNPASDHMKGLNAKETVDRSRLEISNFIGAKEEEVIFTSCATESNNLSITGLGLKHRSKKNHIITTKIEHPSVLNPCQYLESQGFQVTYLSVDQCGLIDIDELTKEINDKTLLVSIIFANNEIGTVQNMEAIGEITREKGVYFHTDAAQAVGHMPINVDQLNIDLMSISAHKFNGPKGIGALFLRNRIPRVSLSPILFGGGQERGIRSGTLNVPLIVGMAEACKIAKKEMNKENERYRQLINRLKEGLFRYREDVQFHGHSTQRLAHNLNIEIPGVDNKWLTLKMKDFCFATGSACSELHDEPSHVLLAIGLDEDRISNCIRVSVGIKTTEDEIDFFLNEISKNICQREQVAN